MPSARQERDGARNQTEQPDRCRIDLWLWHARFFRTRSLAAAAVAAGQVRVDGNRVTRPARPVRPGDTLTFAQGNRIRLIRVEAMAYRRGPAEEAAALFTDLDAAPATSAPID